MKQIFPVLVLTGSLCFLAMQGACAPHYQTVPVSLASNESTRVERALAAWPKADEDNSVKRPFFATIHWAGKRMTASGVFQYYGPKDFRLTAANELGAVLFDGRVTWAGVTVWRHAPGFETPLVETLLSDLSQGMELPKDLNGLGFESKSGRLILEKTQGDGHKHTWFFDQPTGLLRATEVQMDNLGTDLLHVDFRSYNAHGWPEEIALSRPSRGLQLSLSFTDSNLVQSPGTGGSRAQ